MADYVLQLLQSNAVRATIRFPAADGRRVTILGQVAEVHEQDYLDSSVKMDLTIDRTQLEQLSARHQGLEILRDEPA